MIDWLTALHELGRCRQETVLVTVAEARGSTPRAAGTKMIVMGDRCWGTIGGGHLEFKAISIARDLLAGSKGRDVHLQRFPLGPNLGQCCGGMMSLLFERISTPTPYWIECLRRRRNDRGKAVLISGMDSTRPGKMIVSQESAEGGLGDPALERESVGVAQGLLAGHAAAELRTLKVGSRVSARLLFEPVTAGDFQILLFGAGHVGKALVQVLQGLPCDITWIDPRENEFPDIVPANVTIDAGDRPDLAVDQALPASCVLIMTHSHALDQAICERALRRDDLAYCGLIGSATKRARFRRRLAAAGLSERALDGLTCPIGIDGISGKHPGEIAIAVAAELLHVREGRSTASGLRARRPVTADDMSFL